MKKLLLLRHAKSSWNNPNLANFERPLNNRGKQNAATMGKCLRKEKLVPDLIITSAAKRANKTANLVAKKCGYDKKIHVLESSYGGNLENYSIAIHDIGDKHKTVLLVGHNPTIEEVVERIIGESKVISTCTLAHIDLSIDSWKEFNYDVKSKLIDLISVRELNESR